MIYQTFSHYVETNLALEKTRFLGMDVGQKYIGLSLSDDGRVIASPFGLYERKNLQKDSLYFQKIFNDFPISLVVMGMPMNLNGSLSRHGETIVTYADRLSHQQGFDKDIVFWDERFSTMAVERTLLEHNMSRKKREDTIDKLAATYILQGALDYMGMRRK